MTSILDDETEIEQTGEDDADLDVCGSSCVDDIHGVVAASA
jgi:hypothetical protein